MAEAKLIDYYAVLNLPPKADLSGVENAYARLSDDLMRLGDQDDSATSAMQRRKAMAGGLLIGALGLIVAAQAAALLYIGWDSATGLFQAIGSSLF